MAFALNVWRGLLFWPVVAPLFVASLPGAVIVGFLVLKADELLGDFLAGHARQENEIFLATLPVVWAFSAMASYHLLRIDRLAATRGGRMRACSGFHCRRHPFLGED